MRRAVLAVRADQTSHPSTRDSLIRHTLCRLPKLTSTTTMTSLLQPLIIGVDDEQYGQRLKAVIVKKGEITEDEVRAYVKKNLAGYKQPRDVEFVDELPRTSTGKVLKRELM